MMSLVAVKRASWKRSMPLGAMRRMNAFCSCSGMMISFGWKRDGRSGRQGKVVVWRIPHHPRRGVPRGAAGRARSRARYVDVRAERLAHLGCVAQTARDHVDPGRGDVWSAEARERSCCSVRPSGRSSAWSISVRVPFGPSRKAGTSSLRPQSGACGPASCAACHDHSVA